MGLAKGVAPSNKSNSFRVAHVHTRKNLPNMRTKSVLVIEDHHAPPANSPYFSSALDRVWNSQRSLRIDVNKSQGGRAQRLAAFPIVCLFTPAKSMLFVHPCKIYFDHP